MKGWIGLLIVALGIVIAAAFGARNGERHVQYRQAVAEVGMVAEGDDAAMAQAIAHRDSVGLPEPRQRMQQWFSVGGLGWLIGVVLIAIGAFLARSQAAEDASGTGSRAVDLVDFEATIRQARAVVTELRGMLADLGMDQPTGRPRAKLDALANDVLTPLVDGRGQLIAKHGLSGFAQYFGQFSAAERNLNRCWSALTDGHAQAAREALVTADAALEASLAAYQKVDAG